MYTAEGPEPDDIALISDGRLLAFGGKKNVLTEELLEKTFRFDVAGYLRKYQYCIKHP